MSDFVTPGRPSDERASIGSSSRRVMRSALETLLETQSPYLPTVEEPASPGDRGVLPEKVEHIESNSAATATQRKGFTVSYAAQPMNANTKHAASVPAASQSDRLSSLKGRSVMEEPSALLFLSPNGPTPSAKGAKTAGPSAAAVAKADKVTRRHPSRTASKGGIGSASAREPARTEPVLTPSPDASRSLLKDVEQADEATTEKQQRQEQTSRKSKTYTEADFQAQMAEALASYERQRDEEEASVLRQIDKEIGEKEKANRQLLSEKEEVMQIAKSLQAQLTQVVQQCEALQQQNRDALEEQQRLREALGRAEVELCHSQDTVRMHEKQTEGSGASVGRLEEEVRALKATVAAKEAALATAQSDYMTECEDIKSKMLSLGECMRGMEATLTEKDTIVAQLTRKLEEAEKGSHTSVSLARKESETLAKQVTELQEQLQAQTDEVRRRMAKTTTLEAERKTLRQQNAVFKDAIKTTSEQQRSVKDSLETLLAHMKTKMRDLLAKQQTPGVSTTSSPPVNVLDSTNPFEADSDTEAQAVTSLISLSDEDDGDGAGVGKKNVAVRKSWQGPRGRSGSPRITALLFGSRKAKETRRAVSAPAEHAMTGSMTEARAEVTDAMVRALRHSCAASLRATTELGSMVDLYSRRAQRKVGQLRKELDAQAAVAETAEDLAKRLETACRYLKSKLTESEKVASETKIECEAMAKDLSQLEAEADRALAEKETLQARLAELEGAKAEAASRQEAVEQEVLRLHRQLQASTAALTKLETEKTDLEARLAVAEAAADRVPALQEGKLAAEEALGREQATVVRHAERLKGLEKEKTVVAAENTTLKENMKALRSQLEATQAQQVAQRAKDTRDVQHAAAEVKRLTSLLEGAKGECADLRVQLAREAAAAADAVKVKEEQVATMTEAVRTYRGQIAELVREMELRRGGEHATLQAVLETVHAAVKDSNDEDSDHGGDDGDGADAATAGETTPAKATAAVASLSASTAAGISPLSPLPGGAGRSLGSTPGASPAVGVRVALLPGGLRAEKQRRKETGKNAPVATSRKKSTALLRKEAMQAVQRTVLELARLQETVAQSEHERPHHRPEDRSDPVPAATGAPLFDSFQRAERLARESAQRSAQQRRGGHLLFAAHPDRSPFPTARLFAGYSAAEDGDDLAAGASEAADRFFDSPFFGGMGGQAVPLTHSPVVRPPFPAASSLYSSPQRAFSLFPGPMARLPSNSGNTHVSSAETFSVKRVSVSPSLARAAGGSGGLSRSPSSSQDRGGDVDGSGSPARPPTLRVTAL